MPAPEGTCEQAMAWLSARHDGQERDHPRLAAHAADCPACTRFAAGLERLDARIATAPAPAVPEGVLAPALAAWAGRPPAGSGAELAGRLVLALAGCTGIALAVTALVALGGAAQGGQAAVHYGRDLLGFTLAFAVAFLLASRRPGRYGRPLLPITAAAGLFVLLRRRRYGEAALIALPLLYVTGVHVPLLCETRQSLPVKPLVITLAAIAITSRRTSAS